MTDSWLITFWNLVAAHQNLRAFSPGLKLWWQLPTPTILKIEWSDKNQLILTKITLEKLSICRPSCEKFSYQILKQICITPMEICNLEWSFPMIFKFFIFTFIFIPNIPLQNQVTNLKIFVLCPLVTNLLNFILDCLGIVIYFLSCLLQLSHLIYSSLQVIWFYIYFLQQLHYCNS